MSQFRPFTERGTAGKWEIVNSKYSNTLCLLLPFTSQLKEASFKIKKIKKHPRLHSLRMLMGDVWIMLGDGISYRGRDFRRHFLPAQGRSWLVPRQGTFWQEDEQRCSEGLSHGDMRQWWWAQERASRTQRCAGFLSGKFHRLSIGNFRDKINPNIKCTTKIILNSKQILHKKMFKLRFLPNCLTHTRANMFFK